MTFNFGQAALGALRHGRHGRGAPQSRAVAATSLQRGPACNARRRLDALHDAVGGGLKITSTEHFGLRFDGRYYGTLLEPRPPELPRRPHPLQPTTTTNWLEQRRHDRRPRHRVLELVAGSAARRRAGPRSRPRPSAAEGDGSPRWATRRRRARRRPLRAGRAPRAPARLVLEAVQVQVPQDDAAAAAYSFRIANVGEATSRGRRAEARAPGRGQARSCRRRDRPRGRRRLPGEASRRAARRSLSVSASASAVRCSRATPARPSPHSARRACRQGVGELAGEETRVARAAPPGSPRRAREGRRPAIGRLAPPSARRPEARRPRRPGRRPIPRSPAAASRSG